MTEAIIKAIEAFTAATKACTESNQEVLAFLKERDAGWMKLHEMDAELRLINHATDIAISKKRGELLSKAGEPVIVACAINDNRYDVRELLKKVAI